MAEKERKIILVVSPSSAAWEAALNNCEKGDYVIPCGERTAEPPLDMKICVPTIDDVVSQDHGPIFIPGTIELRRAIRRIQRAVTKNIRKLPEELLDGFEEALALATILARQGGTLLLCIPGDEDAEQAFGALSIIAPSIRWGLKIEVLSIPPETTR